MISEHHVVLFAKQYPYTINLAYSKFEVKLLYLRRLLRITNHVYLNGLSVTINIAWLHVHLLLIRGFNNSRLLI